MLAAAPRFALKIALSAVVIAAGAIAIAAASRTVSTADSSSPSLQAPVVSPAGPVFEATGLRPGESHTGQFSISNPNVTDASLDFVGQASEVDRELYDVLTAKLTVVGESQPFWSGNLRELSPRAVTRQLAGQGAEDYELEVGVPIWAGNAYQQLRTEFDLRFALSTPDESKPIGAPRSAFRTRRSTSTRSLRQARRARKPVAMWFEGHANSTEGIAVERVELALTRMSRPTRTQRRRGVKRLCSAYVPLRRKFVRTRVSGCQRFWITANGTNDWSYRFRRQRLQPGRYEILVRAVDAQGNTEKSFRTRGRAVNKLALRVFR